MPTSPILDSLIKRKLDQDIDQLRYAFFDDPNRTYDIDSHITGIGKVRAIYKEFGERAVDVPLYRLLIVTDTGETFIGLTPKDTINDFQAYIDGIKQMRESGLNGFHIQTPSRFYKLLKFLEEYIQNLETANPTPENSRFTIAADRVLPLSSKYSIEGLTDPALDSPKFWTPGDKSRLIKLANIFNAAGTAFMQIHDDQKSIGGNYVKEAQALLKEIKLLTPQDRIGLVCLVAESGKWGTGAKAFAASVLANLPNEVFHSINERGLACNTEISLPLP